MSRFNINDYVITAQLNNKKEIVLQPDYASRKLGFRYMTEQEISTGQLDLNRSYIWLERPIYTTQEGGQTIIFADVEGTAIVLQRFGTK